MPTFKRIQWGKMKNVRFLMCKKDTQSKKELIMNKKDHHQAHADECFDLKDGSKITQYFKREKLKKQIFLTSHLHH